MDIKTFVVASFALVGTYYLGYSLFACLLAFNAVLWLGIVYDMFTSTEDQIFEDLLTKTRTPVQDPMQIAFDRFLIRKFVESTSAEDEEVDDEIHRVQARPLAQAEA